MGFTPQQVYKMSLWEFSWAVHGYVQAHSPGDGADSGLSAAEIAELSAAIDNMPPVVRSKNGD